MVVPLASLYFCWEVKSSPLHTSDSFQLMIYIYILEVFEPVTNSCILILCGLLVCASYLRLKVNGGEEVSFFRDYDIVR